MTDAPPLTTRPRLNAIVYAMLVEELLSGPTTLHTLCAVTGLERKTVRKVLKAMHDRKIVHLSGYEKDCRGRVIVPLWSFGPGKDAKREPKTHAENCRAFRARERTASVARAFAGASNDSTSSAAA